MLDPHLLPPINVDLDTGPAQEWCIQAASAIFVWFSARGAGKTYIALWLAWYRSHVWRDFSCLVLRRNFAELEESVLRRFKQVLQDMDDVESWDIKQAKGGYLAVNTATGASIHFGAADTVERAMRYQGTEYTMIIMDEPQNWRPEVLGQLWALSRARKGKPRPQMYLMANPGGPSHPWLRRTFYDPALRLHATGNLHGVDDDGNLMYWLHPIEKEWVPVQGHWGFKLDISRVLQADLTDGEKLPEELQGLPPMAVEVVSSGTQMNPVLPYKEYHAKMAVSLTPQMRRAWIIGDMTVAVGAFFEDVQAWISKEEIVVGDRDFIVCGIDPGLRKTAAVWFAIDRYGRWRVFDTHMVLNAGAAQASVEIAERHPELHPVTLYVMDHASANRTNEQTNRTLLDAYREFGGIAAVSVYSDRRHGWQILDGMGARGELLIDPYRGRILIDSLAGLQTKEGDEEDCEKWYGSAGQADGDHPSDAARYAIMFGHLRGFDDSDPTVVAWRDRMRNPDSRRRLNKSMAYA